jgi:tripeptide aminopeptidase
MENTNNLLERFLRYVKTWTESNSEQADSGVFPSSPMQTEFAKTLAEELKSIGLNDIFLSEHSYVCGRIPASKGYENFPSVGFLAHMDTVDEVSGKNVNPQVFKNYDGSVLNIGNGIVLDPAKDKHLAESVGQTIITTDGTTLLGADDKAGIAAIMTALENIIKNDIPHGQIEVIFSPDEETGHGMDKVPTEWIQSKQCYTLDGGHIGELEAECFTAYKSEVTFTGVSTHTGTARPNMVNSITMLSAFVNFLPQTESPETTDGYQGFYAPMQISGGIEQSQLIIFNRDFTMEKMQRRLDNIDIFAKAIEAKFPGGKVEVKHTKQYVNMKEKLDQNPLVVEKLTEAVKNLGITPVFSPIRGGTDGSRLTEIGIPTPNVFTGGHNFHSRSEWASLEQMAAASKTVIELVKLWSKA